MKQQLFQGGGGFSGRSIALVVSSLGLFAGACGHHPVVLTDGGATPDASVPHDAGTTLDAGHDGGRLDAGGSGDAGLVSDAGPDDAGASFDGGPVDAGPGLPVVSLQVTDFCNNRVPLAGVQASILGGGGGVAVTDATGYFHLPVPPDMPVTIQLQANNYQVAYLPEIQIDAGFNSPITLPLFCSSTAQALKNSLSGFDPTKGTIMAAIYTLATSGPCTDQSGWTFEISPDGGESIDYVDVNGNPNPALTATTTWGFALIYNIGAPRVLVTATKPDAGCTNVDPIIGMTGYDVTQGMILSYGGEIIQ